MKKITFIVACATSIALFACNGNNANNGGDSSHTETIDSARNMNEQMGTIDNNTSDFVTKAASGGMMEVELGRIAQQNGASERVKNYGAMMVEDHTKANDELKSLASAKNITLPASVDEMHKKHIDDLSKKKGKDFDKAYLDMMVDDHKEDISDFEKQSTNGTDSTIKAFATKTLPVLRKHLDSLRAITGKQ